MATEQSINPEPSATDSTRLRDEFIIKRPLESKTDAFLATSLQSALITSIVSRVDAWPTMPSDGQSPSSAIAGIKHAGTRTMEVKAALSNKSFNPERIYESEKQVIPKTKRINDLRLHLLLEASPEILAVFSSQSKALDVLHTVLSVQGELLGLPDGLAIDHITPQVAFFAVTREGGYWVDMPPFTDEAQLQNFYQEVLVSTLGLGQYSRSAHIGLVAVDEQMALQQYLGQLTDSPYAGIMNLAVIANTNKNVFGSPTRKAESENALSVNQERIGIFLIDYEREEKNGFLPFEIRQNKNK